MKVTQSFTTLGGIGAIAFCVGPLMTGWGYFSAATGRSDPQFVLLLLIVGILATTLAIPAMLIGREYDATDPFPRDAKPVKLEAANPIDVPRTEHSHLLD